MKTYTATPDDISHEWHRRGCRRRAARPAGQRGGPAHSRQAQAHLHAAHGRRRLRGRGERLEGAGSPAGRRRTRRTSPTPATWATSATPPRATCWRSIPDRVIEKAVFGMLPKTSLARQKLRGKLKVYAGAEHPARGAAAQAVLRHSLEGERMTAATRIPLAGRRPAQDQRRPGLPDPRHRQVGHQRPHAGRLLPPSLAGAAHPAVLHRHRHARRVRREGARGRRRAGGAGRRAPARDRAGAGGGRRAAPDQAPRCGSADARPARGRAEEAGPPGSAEAVPVLASGRA